MRESRTYGSGRGACHEMHVPTATSGASSSRCSAARRRVAARGARAAADAMPVIGFLSSRSPRTIRQTRLRAFRQGLQETRLRRGRATCAIEYRWAEGQYRSTASSWRPNWFARQVDVICRTAARRCGARGQGGDRDDPDRLRRWRRPGQAWACRQPGPAGRQRHRH